MKKTYIISYKTDLSFNAKNFHAYINALFTSGYISDWWHYTDNVYIVASELEVNKLYNIVFPALSQKYLLIIEVNPKNSQGWLPKIAWDWIQKYK